MEPGRTANENDPPWVFLSYSRADQPIALEVLAALEAAGITVWWDGLLPGGARYNDVTEHKLENAYAVVTLWSQTSTRSHWVHDEAMRGRDRGCLVPASIDGSEPPLGFRQFQWVSLVDDKGALIPAALDTLVQSVRRMQLDADSGQPVPAVPLSPPAAPTPPGFRVSRRLALGGGAAVLLLGGGALAWRGGLLGGEHENSVAVLPFNRSGGSAEQAYFANGLAAEIRSRLARNPLLKVAAEASSKSVAESDATAQSIAGRLNVAYLLEGSVTRAGDRLQVRVDLIDGGDGTVAVPLEYDQPIADIFDIQGAIAAKVASELANQIDGGASGEAIGGTRSVAAYEAFLRGNDLYENGESEADDREALAKYEEAIKLDPAYAAAHAGKGLALINISNLHAAPEQREGLFEQAIAAGQEAARIAPKFAQGHFVMGLAQAMGKLDMKAARTPYRKAYELGSGDAEIVTRHAIFRSRIGDDAGAEADANRSIALDPLNDRSYRLKGDILYAAGRPAEAIKAFDEARAIGGIKGSYFYRVGLAQLELGQSEAAKASFAQDPFAVWVRTGGAIAEHRLGNRAAAEAHLAALKAEFGDKSSYQYAQIHAQWGEPDKALQALADAWRLKDGGLSQLYRDPLLAPISETSDYRALARKIGFV
jgi:TolB-like protein